MSSGKLMKGHTFKDGKKHLQYPACAEIKLDEIRLDVRYARSDGEVSFNSYADKPLNNLGNYAQRFSQYFDARFQSRLDMGVLVNRSFADTYRYVRSSKGVPADLVVKTLEFILFDAPGLVGPYVGRMYDLDQIAFDLRYLALPVIRPERSFVDDEQQVRDAYVSARERGFEGLMVKDLRHEYELGKRSYGWLKVKPEEDGDGIITAINQAISTDGQPLDRAGSVSFVCEDGSSGACGGIDHDLGRLMLANPEQFVGEWIEFTYMERDRQGGYRHPQFGRLREAKA